ncbi:MAG: bifunctional precorrin-2 dehydrogenase/sirohydrochlorin ferrochelatase [Candidatus Methanomethylophilaceae archaeon]
MERQGTGAIGDSEVHGPGSVTSACRSRYTALFADLHDTDILVIGGGPVALRKCRYLSDADIHVIAKTVLPELEEIADRVECRCVDLEKDIVPGCADMVVAATNSKEMNGAIRDRALSMGIRVNSAHGGGDVLIPSVLERRGYTVAVSSGGSVPAFPPFVIEELDGFLDERFDTLLDALSDIRNIIRVNIHDQKERREFLADILRDREFLDIVKGGDRTMAVRHAVAGRGWDC